MYQVISVISEIKITLRYYGVSCNFVAQFSKNRTHSNVLQCCYKVVQWFLACDKYLKTKVALGDLVVGEKLSHIWRLLEVPNGTRVNFSS